MSYYSTYLEPPTIVPTTTAQGSLFRGTIVGSYILVDPQTIIIPPKSSKTLGTKTIMSGTGNLYVYVVYLNPGNLAFVKINDIDVPLNAGVNKIPLPAGINVGPIRLVNDNTEETLIALWAFLAG